MWKKTSGLTLGMLECVYLFLSVPQSVHQCELVHQHSREDMKLGLCSIDEKQTNLASSDWKQQHDAMWPGAEKVTFSKSWRVVSVVLGGIPLACFITVWIFRTAVYCHVSHYFPSSLHASIQVNWPLLLTVSPGRTAWSRIDWVSPLHGVSSKSVFDVCHHLAPWLY